MIGAKTSSCIPKMKSMIEPRPNGGGSALICAVKEIIERQDLSVGHHVVSECPSQVLFACRGVDGADPVILDQCVLFGDGRLLLRLRQSTPPSIGPAPWLESLSPAFDLGPEPEGRPFWSEVYHRPGHIRVSVLVHADAVQLRKAENLRDSFGIDEVVSIYNRAHRPSLKLNTLSQPCGNLFTT